MNRNIIHIDIIDFHIAVERVLEPRLRQRPVAVAIETASRSLVYAVSGEAQKNGVVRGMPLPQALKYCPDLTVLPPNEELYVRATTAIQKVMGRYTPIVEPLRFGHAYMDMTGSIRLFGRVKDAAARIQREIRDELRLGSNAGVASNKLVSKVASDVVTHAHELRGLCDVRHGYEERFLSPLHVGYLPGVDKPVREQLLDLNVRIIRELALVTSENLQMVFGRFGVLLHQRAHGVDNRPVQPPRRAPEVAQAENLQEDSNDFNLLLSLAYRLLSQGTRSLRAKGLGAGRVVLEVRYSDHKEELAQQRLPATHDESVLVPVVRELLQRALSRRIRVRKLTLRLCDLSQPPQQLSLFAPEHNPRIASLTHAMDKIRDRFGEGAIRFGRAA
jgi:DNA polymerase IV